MIDLGQSTQLFMASTPLVPWTLMTIGFYVLEAGATTDTPSTSGHLRARLGNILCGLLLCIAVFIYTPFINRVTESMTGHAGRGLIDIHFLPQYPWLSMMLAVLIILFVRDLFFYAWHRTEHKIPWLWDIHAVHHSEEKFNSTTYMRQNWVDGILQGLFVSAPVVLLFNAEPAAQYAAYLLSMAWNFFAHADVRLQMGGLTPLLTGPQLHRLHHSQLKQHHDSNYAQFFPVWDILFRSYVPPGRGEFPPTGLAYGERIESVEQMMLWPLRQWTQRLKRFFRA